MLSGPPAPPVPEPAPAPAPADPAPADAPTVADADATIDVVVDAVATKATEAVTVAVDTATTHALIAVGGKDEQYSLSQHEPYRTRLSTYPKSQQLPFVQFSLGRVSCL